MEKNIRSGIIQLSAAVALCFALPVWNVSGEEFIRKPAAETYTDPSTSIVFPSRVESFEKVMVRINPSPMYGTDIAYENETGAFADVYIYRLTGEKPSVITPEQFKAHSAETVEKILKMPERTPLIRHVESVRDAAKDILPSGVFTAHFRIEAEKEVFRSSLYLFARKEYMIKIRITYTDTSDTDKQSAHSFLHALLSIVGFPAAK